MFSRHLNHLQVGTKYITCKPSWRNQRWTQVRFRERLRDEKDPSIPRCTPLLRPEEKIGKRTFNLRQISANNSTPLGYLKKKLAIRALIRVEYQADLGVILDSSNI